MIHGHVIQYTLNWHCNDALCRIWIESKATRLIKYKKKMIHGHIIQYALNWHHNDALCRIWIHSKATRHIKYEYWVIQWDSIYKNYIHTLYTYTKTRGIFDGNMREKRDSTHTVGWLLERLIIVHFKINCRITALTG